MTSSINTISIQQSLQPSPILGTNKSSFKDVSPKTTGDQSLFATVLDTVQLKRSATKTTKTTLNLKKLVQSLDELDFEPQEDNFSGIIRDNLYSVTSDASSDDNNAEMSFDELLKSLDDNEHSDLMLLEETDEDSVFGEDDHEEEHALANLLATAIQGLTHDEIACCFE